MASKKGLWIALGSCGFLIFAAVAFVGLMIFVVVRHLEIRPATTASAEQEFGRLRDRFTGRPPLIEIDGDNPGRIQVHRSAEANPRGGSISALHIFVWNKRDGKVVKLDLPIWLLRLGPHSDALQWNWSGSEVDWDRVQITLEDLERHGPGLIVDFEGHRGEHLLVWSE